MSSKQPIYLVGPLVAVEHHGVRVSRLGVHLGVLDAEPEGSNDTATVRTSVLIAAPAKGARGMAVRATSSVKVLLV